MIALIGGLSLMGCNSGKTATPTSGKSDVPPNRAGEFEQAAAARSNFVGQPAPGFALLDQNDKAVRLTDLKGQWVVLYFYPKDDTPGCTCQATEFTELLRTFRDHNARVIGVSGDSPGSHRFFRQKYDLKIQLLSDPDFSTMLRYGAYAKTQQGNKQIGRVIRSTVIIDPNGKIAAHYPEVIPEGHAERVMEKLKALQAGS